MKWLDTETRAILRKIPESKQAPPKVAEFALVLLRKGTSRERLVKAIRQINNCTEAEAVRLECLPVPIPINLELTEEEALYGQFELICSDAIAAFFRSEVIAGQDQKYLSALYEKILASPEFKEAKIDVLDVPETEAGQKFVEQFLGQIPSGSGRRVRRFSLFVPSKKARIMKHWADRTGVQMRCDAPPNPHEPEAAFGDPTK